MKKKKTIDIVALALTLVLLLPLLLLCLSACAPGGSEEPLDSLDIEPDTAVEEVVQETESSPEPTPEPSPEPSMEPEPDEADLQEEEPSPEPEPVIELIKVFPAWMYIPAIGVDAEVTDTQTDYVHDTMEIYPSGDIISWWRGSAIPGNPGNAIFGGHNKWSGALGQLYALDTLEIGDEMEIVYTDGTSLKFRLESVFVYLLATAPADVIMDVKGESRVTIITCKEPFNPVTGTSDNRIIAIFKEESVFVVPDPPIEPFPLREG